MEEQELYCLGKHFKCFYEQGTQNKPFNFSEPCNECIYVQSCKGDWLKMRNSLERETGIVVNVIKQE